jgi:hypothetical protein
MRKRRSAHRISVGMPEGKNSLGRSRSRCVDNIKIDLGEIGWGGIEWIYLAHGRHQGGALVNTVMYLRIP